MICKRPMLHTSRPCTSFPIPRYPSLLSVVFHTLLITPFPVSQEDPKLWYGIGILYDRYGSLDHAEEAFSSVLKMDKGQWRMGVLASNASIACS